MHDLQIVANSLFMIWKSYFIFDNVDDNLYEKWKCIRISETFKILRSVPVINALTQFDSIVFPTF